MIRVDRLIAALRGFPPDARAHAYSGEITGVVVNSADGRQQIGYILADEGDEENDGTAVHEVR